MRTQSQPPIPRPLGKKPLLGSLMIAAMAVTGATNSMAAGTTGDFGKRLERTTTLHHFQVDKDKYIGQRFDFDCPATTVRDKPVRFYGSDVYPANTPMCVAARHAGAIDENGGPILVQLNPGISQYEGTVRNDVESSALAGGTKLSISFVTAGNRASQDALQQKWKPRLAWDDKFSQTGLANIRLTGQRFAFECPSVPGKLPGRRVYGTDSYPLNSYVCLAAVHAGQIEQSGGSVLIQMDPALDGKFVGSMRNGIESKNGPKSPRSISFPGATGDQGQASGIAIATPEAGSDPVQKVKKGLAERSVKGLFK